ncbi:hypothetical protein [Pandoravirus japonicus]|uniref:Transmembrane protein n=1 Tax=Pandoravirus japonicus TaxID=2823154 RepID=A0A811BPP9_9VIRU|nr:hypothetical protein [Pandoravirus japonicus]
MVFLGKKKLFGFSSFPPFFFRLRQAARGGPSALRHFSFSSLFVSFFYRVFLASALLGGLARAKDFFFSFLRRHVAMIAVR